jgi:hypothetical protein
VEAAKVRIGPENHREKEKQFVGKLVSSVSIVTGHGMDDRVSISDKRKIFFSTLQRPDSLWVQPSVISRGYWGDVLGVKAAVA